MVTPTSTGYTMYYVGADTVYNLRIGLATSTDGVTWDKELSPFLDIGNNGAWDDSYIFPSGIIEETSHFRFYYTGANSSWLLNMGLYVSCK